MQNYYEFIIPRLDGSEIRKNFRQYGSLVKKGIAGFIVFGGELQRLKKHIADLQNEAGLPLIIASDLERGLGQQVKGGTLFPPAMALASAIQGSRVSSPVRSTDLKLFRDACSAIADEAAYAGINTIFAPVLDINTNPRNPIIAARAFGEDSETVSLFGGEMIRTFQAHGIAACGKHFPGHGDTEVDSHIRLPVVGKTLRRLMQHELKPFQRAIEEKVKMIMLGHLNVPALDSSGVPMSLSKKAVGFLREKMQYSGIVITDAMNMGGIGTYSEEKAAIMALDAGVDILLHPTEPRKIVSSLEAHRTVCDAERVKRFRMDLGRRPTGPMPEFALHRRLAGLLTGKAVRLTADFRVSGNLLLIILNDDEQRKGQALVRALKEHAPSLKTRIIREGADIQEVKIPASSFVVTAVFCETKAWKGGASAWLSRQMATVENRADVVVSFGSPYLFEGLKIRSTVPKIFAYGDSEAAQTAVAGIIGKRAR